MTRLLPVLCALALPGAAWAATVGGESTADFLWELANLALLIGVIVYFARKPVQNYLAERRDAVRNNLETSEKLLKDAEERLREWSRRAAGLDAEVVSIREAARKAAEQEAAGIVADAEATATRIRANAHVAVESEVRRARDRLRAEAGELAVTLASELLRQQVTDADRDRLVDEFVSKVEQGGTH